MNGDRVGEVFVAPQAPFEHARVHMQFCMLTLVPAAACPSESTLAGMAGMVLALRSAAAASFTEDYLHQPPLGVELCCLRQVLLEPLCMAKTGVAPTVKCSVDPQMWVFRVKQSVRRPLLQI